MLVPGTTALLAIGIFILDTVTPNEVSAATFYVVVVLLSLRFCRARGMIVVSVLCAFLSLVSYLLTAQGHYESGLINTSISLVAIAATAYLAAKAESNRLVAENIQAQLAHAARIATLGEISASIAHEVNQPLAAIVTNANACTRWINARPPNLTQIAASIEDIAEDANRASGIVNRIRALAKRADPKRELIEINAVINEVLTLMQPRFQENRIGIRTALGGDLPMIYGDRVQLQQVALNLLVNAIDAINASSTDRREIRVVSARSIGSGVTVAMEDSGVGISAKATNHLFDAFHSTKSDGMGIGLSICRSIVEAHGGDIWASPNMAQGAVFYFTLPEESEGKS